VYFGNFPGKNLINYGSKMRLEVWYFENLPCITYFLRWDPDILNVLFFNLLCKMVIYYRRYHRVIFIYHRCYLVVKLLRLDLPCYLPYYHYRKWPFHMGGFSKNFPVLEDQ